MVVNSFSFLVFFIVVFFIYYLPIFKNTPKYQNLWLFFTSYFFYGYADWRMIPLLLGATTIFWWLGLWLKKELSNGHDKLASRLTKTGVVLGIGVLFYFKYLDFFAGSFATLFRSVGLNVSWTTLNIVLPIGVSFFTFKLISYVIEIHREHMEPCKDFVEFAAYIAFFPTILSGPIDRPNLFIPQLNVKRIFDYAQAVVGCRQILWGMFLKMCVADRLSSYTDVIFNNPTACGGTSILIAVLLYPMQMYTDFAGYSEMAIGVGKILGFNVTKNFDYPYLKTSIPTFWRGWHMSLTSWLTDYVFMPLNIRWRDWGWKGSELAIVITFVLCGLWHGASWPFVIWGLYHGLLFFPSMATGSFFKKKKIKITTFGLPSFPNVVRIISVYLLVAFGLIIFRSVTIDDVITIISRMVNNQDLTTITYATRGVWYFVYTFLLMLLVVFKDVKDVFLADKIKVFEHPKRYVRWGGYYLLIVMIVWFGINSEAGGNFIYFNF